MYDFGVNPDKTSKHPIAILQTSKSIKAEVLPLFHSLVVLNIETVPRRYQHLHQISNDHVLLSLQKVAFTAPWTQTPVPTKHLFETLDRVQEFTVVEATSRMIYFDLTDDVDAILNDPQELKRFLKAANAPYHYDNRPEAQTAYYWSRSRGVEIFSKIQFSCYAPPTPVAWSRRVASGVGSPCLVVFLNVC